MTFSHSPITATTIVELTELVGPIEGDPDLNVVVFGSVNPDIYPVARAGGLLAVATLPAVTGLGDTYTASETLREAYPYAMAVCSGLLAAGAVPGGNC